MLAKLRSPTYHVEQNTSEIEQPLQLKDSTAPKSVPPMHWLVVDPNEGHSVVSPGDFDRQYMLVSDADQFAALASRLPMQHLVEQALDAVGVLEARVNARIEALESRVAEINQHLTLISRTGNTDWVNEPQRPNEPTLSISVPTARPISKASTLDEIQAQATQAASAREGVRFK